jgi:hypothetical protein
LFKLSSLQKDVVMKSCIALFFIFAVITANAFEWHVYCETTNGMTGNQQLTNAFIQAKAGDTITIHKGTYNLATEEMIFRYEKEDGSFYESAGTCLYSSVDNLTVQGDPNEDKNDIVLSGLGENPASTTGLHTIMRLAGANCVARNLTFYKGTAATSGIVYWNSKVMNTGDNNVYRRGGGLVMMGNGICSNCVFDSCYALHGSGLVGAKEAVKCEFLRNNNNANNNGCAT